MKDIFKNRVWILFVWKILQTFEFVIVKIKEAPIPRLLSKLNHSIFSLDIISSHGKHISNNSTWIKQVILLKLLESSGCSLWMNGEISFVVKAPCFNLDSFYKCVDFLWWFAFHFTHISLIECIVATLVYLKHHSTCFHRLFGTF